MPWPEVKEADIDAGLAQGFRDGAALICAARADERREIDHRQVRQRLASRVAPRCSSMTEPLLLPDYRLGTSADGGGSGKWHRIGRADFNACRILNGVTHGHRQRSFLKESISSSFLWPRRAVLSSLLVAAGSGVGAFYGDPLPAEAAEGLVAIPMTTREKAMRRAIAVAKRNPTYPFGAVITRIADGRVMAEGVNDSSRNPMLHGEVSAMNDYLHHHGNRDWAEMALYTTAEPCAMCMSALVWAGIGGVIFGT